MNRRQWMAGMFGVAATRMRGAERVRNVVYKRVDGQNMMLDIYTPTQRKFDKAPVLYFIHGGGWVKGARGKVSNEKFFPVFTKALEAGLACVSVDYRLVDEAHTIMMRDCLVDAQDGLRFLRKDAAKYGLDADRIVIWGSSAGAQMAQVLAFSASEDFQGDPELAKFKVRPAAGISWFGTSDFTDPQFIKPERFILYISRKKLPFTEDPEPYKEMSSYYRVHRGCPPMLLLHGERDHTFKVQDSWHLKKKGDEVGAQLEIQTVQNAGHSWVPDGGEMKPSLAEIHAITAEYAARHVRGQHA